MVTRINRKIYNNAINDRESLKALSFAILAKNIHQKSVFKDWSYESIAAAFGCSQNTARKRIGKLKEMGLVELKNEKGHPYLVFNRLRSAKILTRYRGFRYPKNKDVVIERIDASSLKNIETGLKAQLIVEIEVQKDWYKHRPIRKRHGSVVRSTRFVNPNFKDYGISRGTLAARLHCSQNSLSKIIEYGEKNNLFRCKRAKIEEFLVERGYARQAWEDCEEIRRGWDYAMNSRLCRRSANRYALVP